ncbi:hypothetical protein Q9189_001040, partial [Teloschistes chrysophthalmus]
APGGHNVRGGQQEPEGGEGQTSLIRHALPGTVIHLHTYYATITVLYIFKTAMSMLQSIITPQSLLGTREEYPALERQLSYYNPLNTFALAKGDQKHYQQQYGDMYFLRLAKIKPTVEAYAHEQWKEFEV